MMKKDVSTRWMRSLDKAVIMKISFLCEAGPKKRLKVTDLLRFRMRVNDPDR